MTEPSPSALTAERTVRWLVSAAEAVARETDRLTELDSPIGDADHGSNMHRGFDTVRESLETEAPETPGAVLRQAGRLLVSKVGGASGPLYGTLLRRTGRELGDSPEVSGTALATALRAGVDAVAQLGGAAPGDKTMLDALDPAVTALHTALESGETLDTALAHARAAAEEGAAATVPLRARKGRASYLGERSEGHLDPGAASSALLVGALVKVVTEVD